MSLSFEHLKFKPFKKIISTKAIYINGVDALAYLNSQMTNNVSKIQDSEFQFNSLLDLSGKIISSFILCRTSLNQFRAIVADDYVETTFDRLNKYHISEDLEISIQNESNFLVCHSKDHEGFSGTYFFEYDKVSTSSDLDELSDDDFKKLRVLSGIPHFGLEVLPGELINNTYFDELSVDYKKGCYPGQETVSKIETRRGAAYKPVLIILKEKIDVEEKNIFQNNRKIGSILISFSEDSKTYLMASLLREFRVNQSELNFTINDKSRRGIVHYYPYLSQTKNDLAIDLYDHALVLFHENKNEDAIKYFLKSIDTNPLFEDAYESLGVLYGRLERFDDAIDTMKKLRDLNPKCMMALTNLSLYHMKIGKIEEAEKFKGDATFLNFELLGDEAQRKKAQEELEAKKLFDRERREGMFAQVLEMDPEDAMANNGMGEILLEKKEYEKAISYFENAIKSNIKYSVAYLGLSKSLYQLNKIDNLKEVLKKGIEIASKNGDLMPANEMQSMLQRI